MNDRVVRKVVALIALLIVLFQSFSIPVVASTVQPWTGNPWSGEPWSGNKWDPQQFQWEGSPWEGTPWEGKGTEGSDWEGTPWEGNGTEGNDWNGNGTNGNVTQGNEWEGTQWESLPWYLDPWVREGWQPGGFNGSPFNGNGTTGNPFDGNPTNGSPFSGNETNGSPFNGNGTNGSPFNGNGTTGNPFDGGIINGSPFNGNGTNGNPYNGNGTNGATTNENGAKGSQAGSDDENTYSAYDWFKFGINDVGMSSIKSIAENDITFSNFKNWDPTAKEFYRDLMINSFKFGAKDIEFLEFGVDAMDSVENVSQFAQNYKKIGQVTTAMGSNLSPFLSNPKSILTAAKSVNAMDVVRSASQFTQNTANSFKAMAPLSKLNVAGAVVGAGFSAYDSYNSAVDLFKADTGKERVKAGADLAQNSGSLLMNVGTGVAAFPGGQVVGGALIAGGAILWAGGTIVKHWGTVKDAVKNPGKTLKKIGEGTVKKAKKAWSTVKGWFS